MNFTFSPMKGHYQPNIFAPQPPWHIKACSTNVTEPENTNNPHPPTGDLFYVLNSETVSKFTIPISSKKYPSWMQQHQCLS